MFQGWFKSSYVSRASTKNYKFKSYLWRLLRLASKYEGCPQDA